MKKKTFNNHQQGAALVIVMAFLAAGLIVGISGMNASYIDERLAGNYRATSEVYMVAESTAATTLANYNDSDFKLSLDEASFFDEDCSAVVYDDDKEWFKVLTLDIFSEGDDESLDEDKAHSNVLYKLLGSVIGCQSEGEDVYIVKGYFDSNVTTSEFIKVVFDVYGKEASSGMLLAEGDIKVSGSTLIRNLSSDSEKVSIHSDSNEPVLNVDESSDLLDITYPEISAEKRIIPTPDDDGETDYVNKVVSYHKNNPSDSRFYKSCDPDDAALQSASFVICEGEMSGNLKENLNGKVIIATEGININPTGGSEFGNVSFVSTGNITLQGMGGSGFKGAVWSGGKIEIKGNNTATGTVISKGSININGGPTLEYDPAVLEGLNIAGVVDSPFSASSGSSGSSKPNLVSWGAWSED
ncbi:pilus assembly PilX N-terminal domain-containing protein [Vreelandella aquamarina]|uniref:pilus assembly PilX family protein n=1 Tax=Vreelandella aquamarina TaxID=77097 RepID=UPI00384F631B